MRLELWITLGLFIMTLRSLLIVLGVYKTPVLRRFEDYGNESYYSPMLGLLAWSMGLFIFFMLLFVYSGSVFAMAFFMMSPMILLYYKSEDLVRDFPEIFLKSPVWYLQLTHMCSRDDRRRLAYMWLRLPLRTRLLYSTNNYQFMKWVDLVVVSIA